MRGTRSQNRIWVLVAVVGLFAVMTIAAGLQGIPALDRRVPLWEQTPPPSATPPPPPSITARPSPDEVVPSDGSLVWLILAIVTAVLVAWALIRLVLLALRHRRTRREYVPRRLEVAAEEVAVDAPEPVEEAVRTGIAEALRAIAEHRVPGDAIIAAWVWLEESAARSGLERGVSETPAEFARRLISRRAAVAHDAALLLGLYERVRFGGYAADEADRAAAHDALVRIEWEWQ